jgi:hypothetical protein
MMASNKRGGISVARLRLLLTERDEAILQSLLEHKFLTSRQICALHFRDHASQASSIRACTRVLNRLFEQKLLYRLERPVGGPGGGSASNVWSLAAAGDRYVKYGAAGGDYRRARAFEPSTAFLAHTLGIAELRIELEELRRAGRIELLEITTEPKNWRTYLGRHGERLVLKPDLHVVTAQGEFEDHWFVELDRGTESLPTLIRKSEMYTAYMRSGAEQRKTGIFPKVLWVMPTPRRVELLQSALRGSRIEPTLFEVIDSGQFAETIAPDSSPLDQVFQDQATEAPPPSRDPLGATD